ncbi:ribonuclease P protein component [Candidatus Gottesmanbacteria bacterium]|nr:ribonuclease P protein component [Candidatus Gottesmanbacteria bacterium]
MVPREHRLPSPEIKSLMRGGKRVNGDGISLIYRKRDGAVGTSRFAVVVPVSVDKRAVGRNRLKRLTRESLRLALGSLAPGWDGVVLVRKGLGDGFAVVDHKVRGLLRQVGILV